MAWRKRASAALATGFWAAGVEGVVAAGRGVAAAVWMVGGVGWAPVGMVIAGGGIMAACRAGGGGGDAAGAESGVTTVPSGRIETVRTFLGSPRLRDVAGPPVAPVTVGAVPAAAMRAASFTSIGCSSRLTTLVSVDCLARS